MTEAEPPRADAPVVLGSLRSIVRPRSVTCGAVCRSEPCTLRQIRHAQRALTDNPELVLWAELSVLGHLVGQPMPVPVSGLADALTRWPQRYRECAMSHAVDAAIAGRVATFTHRHSPDELAKHVNGAMRRWVISDVSICDDSCRGRLIDSPLDAGTWHTVRFGHGAPSWLEHAIGARSEDSDWLDRLGSATTDFISMGWPLRYLRGDA
jgi:hypothetical protein